MEKASERRLIMLGICAIVAFILSLLTYLVGRRLDIPNGDGMSDMLILLCYFSSLVFGMLTFIFGFLFAIMQYLGS